MMRSLAPSRGFTLIEVLVALAIVGIALAAGLQATNALTRNALRQSTVLPAHICAENQLVQVRLAARMPNIGDSSEPCQQGGASSPSTWRCARRPTRRSAVSMRRCSRATRPWCGSPPS